MVLRHRRIYRLELFGRFAQYQMLMILLQGCEHLKNCILLYLSPQCPQWPRHKRKALRHLLRVMAGSTAPKIADAILKAESLLVVHYMALRIELCC